MLKMRDVYVQNPALGDASSLDKQVDENAQKLDKLRQELQKYEVFMWSYFIQYIAKLFIAYVDMCIYWFGYDMLNPW